MKFPSAQEIDEFYQSISKLNHYEVLGVSNDASKQEIALAYRQLAMRWHVDRFPSNSLDEKSTQQVREIFQRINEANRTLFDERSRESYDAQLSGAPSVGELLLIENKFLKGRRALIDKNVLLAKSIFDEVADSVPENPNYRFHKVYTDFYLLPLNPAGEVDRDVGAPMKEEMEKLFKKYDEKKDWMYEFLGVVSMRLGEKNDALRYFKEASKLNPHNLNVQQYLRLWERRTSQKQEKPKSFWENMKSLFAKK